MHSHLMYGIQAWGNADSGVMNSIFKLQKKSMRIINNMPYRGNTGPLFKKNKTLKVTDMHNLQILLFMNDYKNSKLPQSFINYFGDVNVNLRRTSRYNFMHRHAARTKLSSKLPFHHFPTSYNAIVRNLELQPTSSN